MLNTADSSFSFLPNKSKKQFIYIMNIARAGKILQYFLLTFRLYNLFCSVNTLPIRYSLHQFILEYFV